MLQDKKYFAWSVPFGTEEEAKLYRKYILSLSIPNNVPSQKVESILKGYQQASKACLQNLV